MTKEKQCHHCGNSFTASHGKQKYCCISCKNVVIAQQRKNWVAKNQESQKDNIRRWVAENCLKVLETNYNYAKKNKDKVKQYKSNSYYKQKQLNGTYYQRNKEKVKAKRIAAQLLKNDPSNPPNPSLKISSHPHTTPLLPCQGIHLRSNKL